MKFDYIIQNPPYSGSFHLTFLKKGLSLLKENGKMTIIEPSTWLINLRKNGKAELYDDIKNTLQGHVYKIIIENYNEEFNIGLQMPFSICYIDFSKNWNQIEFHCCGERKIVNSLYDCNLIGNHKTIDTIFKKIEPYDKLKKHIYKPNIHQINDNMYFAAIAKVMRGGIGDPRFSDEWFIDGFYRCYFYHCFNDKEPISKSPHHLLQTGYTYECPKYKKELALNIFGTYEELMNFKHFIYCNKLSLFLNICIIQDMNINCIHDYIPWIADKQYTDEEIYQMLDFSKEEIAFINNVIKKYERHSIWFKRYMCGEKII